MTLCVGSWVAFRERECGCLDLVVREQWFVMDGERSREMWFLCRRKADCWKVILGVCLTAAHVGGVIMVPRRGRAADSPIGRDPKIVM